MTTVNGTSGGAFPQQIATITGALSTIAFATDAALQGYGQQILGKWALTEQYLDAGLGNPAIQIAQGELWAGGFGFSPQMPDALRVSTFVLWVYWDVLGINWQLDYEVMDAISGLQGAPGAKGDKGDTGLTGATGSPGTPGAKGDTGDTGATGSPGTPGAKGDKGDTGLTGSTGAPGAPGSTKFNGAYIFTDTAFASQSFYTVVSTGHTLTFPDAAAHSGENCLVVIVTGITLNFANATGQHTQWLKTLTNITSYTPPAGNNASLLFIISNGANWEVVDLSLG